MMLLNNDEAKEVIQSFIELVEEDEEVETIAKVVPTTTIVRGEDNKYRIDNEVSRRHA